MDKNFGDLNEIQEEYLNDAFRSSKHLLSLINDILDLSKIETGKMELKASDVNLRSLLKNSLSIIRQKAVENNIKLSLDVDGIPETICVDERKFKQIIYNLLSNAVKFTPEGGSIDVAACRLSRVYNHMHRNDGSKITLPMRDGRWLAAQSQFMQITVKDTGIGLKQGNLERIFQPFDQVDNSMSRIHPGAGLGLSLGKNFVELHGGRIWGESKGEGLGTAFHFVIPDIAKVEDATDSK